MFEFKSQHAKQKRVVGLDFGMARIGVAVSDGSRLIATPICVLACEKKTDATVEKLFKELKKHQELYNYEIEEIVIGLPLLLSGKKGLLADEVAYFVEALKKQSSIPVITWDERLTTAQAERSLNESSLTRKRRSQVVDTVAAIIILQSYLDFKRI